MSTVGYLRCSSDSQDTLRQRQDIERSKIRIDQWLEDHESQGISRTSEPTSNACCALFKRIRSIRSLSNPSTASA